MSDIRKITMEKNLANSSVVSRWHWPSLKIDLLIAKAVIDIFTENRQTKNNKERGGQLFIDLSFPKGLLVAVATPPHPKDYATTHSLFLDSARCCEEIKFFNDKGLRLVGYWHTHPELDPLLSSQDLRSFQKFSNENSNKLPYPLAVIVGLSRLRVWSMRQLPLSGDIRSVV